MVWRKSPPKPSPGGGRRAGCYLAWCTVYLFHQIYLPGAIIPGTGIVAVVRALSFGNLKRAAPPRLIRRLRLIVLVFYLICVRCARTDKEASNNW